MPKPTKKWNLELHRAARDGSVEGCALAWANGADLGVVDTNGSTALMVAIRNGRKYVAAWLVEAMTPGQLDAVQGGGVTAMGLAIGYNLDSELFKSMVRRGAGLDGPPGGQNPLTVAAEAGMGGVVEDLLAMGADPMRRDGEGASALWRAVEDGMDFTAASLLPVSDLGVSIDGVTLFMLACKRGAIRSARALASPQEAGRRDDQGLGAMDHAIASDADKRCEVLELLLAHVDPWEQSCLGLIPLLALANRDYTIEDEEDGRVAGLIVGAMAKAGLPDYEMLAAVGEALGTARKGGNFGVVDALEPIFKAVKERMAIEHAMRPRKTAEPKPSKARRI